MNHLFKKLLLLGLFSPVLLTAQHVWVGGIGQWDVATNWMPATVPTALDDVLIQTAGDEVTIPMDYHAFAKSVNVSNTAILNVGVVTMGGTILEINNSTGNAITVNNASMRVLSAEIRIGNTNPIGEHGILIQADGNASSFFGDINIDRVNNPGFNAIQVEGSSSSFANQGTINIGQNTSINQHGILVRDNASFTNAYGTGDGDPSGTIYIDNCGGDGIRVHDAGTRFKNEYQIFIGNTGPINQNGIYVYGGSEFNNSGFGFGNCLIRINRITLFNGLEITDVNTIFYANEGTIQMGDLAPIKRNGIQMRNGAVMEQSSDGQIYVDNITDNDGWVLSDAGTVVNSSGTIRIGDLFPVKWDGIRLRTGAYFNQTEPGSIHINRISDFDGILLEDLNTKFDNSSIIKIGNDNTVKRTGIYAANSSQFNNLTLGSIKIDRITGTITGTGIGVLVAGANASFNNDGSIIIGFNQPVQRFGVGVDGCIFNNNGLLSIDRIADFDAIALISTGAQFNNTSTVQIGSEAAIGRHGFFLDEGVANNIGPGSVTINLVSNGQAIQCTN
jgi:uncharacterized protein (UPF0254 family)